ncbi:MAG TPA: rhodanese-like domain-containing protein [Gemmatales bacterium]|nr:rhodanese-like domain-containing protein [Gemmatales bacterium]
MSAKLLIMGMLCYQSSLYGGTTNAPIVGGGPYCGVYCVQAALAALGTPADMAALMDARYVTSFNGSSAIDLIRAVRDQGADAQMFTGLSLSTLRLANQPIILHVRKAGFGNPFSHWVLFLGMEGDQARILDPPHELEQWDLGDVAAVWNGVGVVVSKEPIDRWPMLALDVVVNVLLAGAALLLVLLSRHWLLGGGHSTRLPAIGGTAVLLLSSAGLLALVWHFCLPEGFARSPTALRLVRAQHFQRSFPEVDVELIKRIARQEEPDTVLVDARFPGAFAMGHIPGAINIPVTSHVQGLKRPGFLNPAARYVVYCQSAGCEWSDLIANKLSMVGVRQIEIYRQGYREWEVVGWSP